MRVGSRGDGQPQPRRQGADMPQQRDGFCQGARYRRQRTADRLRRGPGRRHLIGSGDAERGRRVHPVRSPVSGSHSDEVRIAHRRFQRDRPYYEGISGK